MEGEREGDRAEHVFQCVISVRAFSVDIGPVRIALAKKLFLIYSDGLYLTMML